MRQFLAFGRISHIIYFQVDSDPEVHSLLLSFFFTEWRSVHSRCFSLQFLALAQFALGNLDMTTTSPTYLAKQMMDGF